MCPVLSSVLGKRKKEGGRDMECRDRRAEKTSVADRQKQRTNKKEKDTPHNSTTYSLRTTNQKLLKKPFSLIPLKDFNLYLRSP